MAVEKCCFNCGKPGHRADNPKAECFGKPPVPSARIDCLHSIIASAYDETNDDPSMLYALFHKESEATEDVDVPEEAQEDAQYEDVRRGFH